jgi:DNA ligase-1
MLLAEVVTTSAEVTATPSRSAKIDALSRLLRRLEPEEVPSVVGYLVGQPRQGRIGVGWATVARLDVTHAATPTLTIADLDRIISEIQLTTGAGSVGNRNALLRLMLQRATAVEAEFIRRLFTGEIRQGALAGVMTEAVARAADVPAAAVRRAVLLSGDLGAVARIASGDGLEGLARIGLEVLRPLSPMLASTAASDGGPGCRDGTGLGGVEARRGAPPGPSVR